MKYIRVYSDEDGESHFEEIEIDFQSVDFAPPAPPLDIANLGSADNCSIIRGPKDWYGDWHPAPFRQWHFYLSGEIEVETSDGRRKNIKAGDIVLVEDTTGKGHKSWVVGSRKVVIASVKLSEIK